MMTAGRLLQSSQSTHVQKIAIVGSGISGLTAAWKLGTVHDVTLFEADSRLGGHTNTVDVQLDGRQYAIDTGFIVFNDRTYPKFIRMLNELGVRSRPTSMSFSVRCDRTGTEYCGSSLNGLFAQRSNLLRPRFWTLIRDILRFGREATSIADTTDSLTDRDSKGLNSTSETMTVAEFLKAGRYSKAFAELYLLPMGAAIWSCPTGTFAEFPVRFVIEFYRNHGLLSLRDRPTWRVIEGGSRTYVDALRSRLRGTVYLNSPIRSVRRDSESVEVTAEGHGRMRFDHIVFACHSDQALKLLADPTPVEKDVLSAFPYERSVALLHTDTSVLPKRRHAWASWNYHLQANVSGTERPALAPQSSTALQPRSSSADIRPTRGATVTYCMNILQHIQSPHVFSVTLNSEDRIDPRTILGRYVYEHPVFTTRRAAAQSRHHELIDTGRTSFCGAYWRNGFHEDGVVSALAVCSRLLPEVEAAAQ